MIARIAKNKKVSPSIISSHPMEEERLGINSADLSRLRVAMLKTFYDTEGTGYANRIEDERYKIAGKTSTSQVVGIQHKSKKMQHQDHSIFVGFAPFEKPKFAIATVIEHGGWGSKIALPISKNILFDIKDY
jgi:penicillin-binding protein 2